STPQFSGPFRPRPPETTSSASVSGTAPVTLLVSFTCTPKSLSSKLTSSFSTVAEPSPFFTGKVLGIRVTTLISLVTLTWAKALPEKTVFFTTKPLAVSGCATAPATIPAFSLAATRGATDLPVTSWLATTTYAPSFTAASTSALV